MKTKVLFFYGLALLSLGLLVGFMFLGSRVEFYSAGITDISYNTAYGLISAVFLVSAIGLLLAAAVGWMRGSK